MSFRIYTAAALHQFSAFVLIWSRVLGLSLVSLSVESDRHSVCFVLNFTWQFSINAFVVQQNTASLTLALFWCVES